MVKRSINKKPSKNTSQKIKPSQRKKINKSNKSSKKNTKLNRELEGPKESIPINTETLIEDLDELECEVHRGQNVYFICTKLTCLKELCSFCIMDHKYHISEIEILKNVVSQNLDYLKDFSVHDQQINILDNQK